MGRRPSLFSKRSQKAYFSMSPTSKIGLGITFLIVGVLTIIFSIIFLTGYYPGLLVLPIIFAVITIFLSVISIYIGISENSEQKEYESQVILSNINDIDEMSGIDFEHYLAALFKQLGYSVSLTKTSGDYGVDLILRKETAKIIVQAKCYKNKVPIKAVQEISAARSYYETSIAWVITNNYFTQPAINLAEANGVRLIDRKELISLICKVKDPSPAENNVKQDSIKCEEYISATLTKETNKSQQLERSVDIYDLKINDYNNSYSDKLQKIKQNILYAYSKMDMDSTKKSISQAEKLEIKSEQNRISLHFFYSEISEIIYAYRYTRDDAIKYCLEICEKDRKLCENIHSEKWLSFKTLTRQAIIYEKSQQLDKAIEICDYAIKNKYLDNSKNFTIRKARLLKKQKK